MVCDVCEGEEPRANETEAGNERRETEATTRRDTRSRGRGDDGGVRGRGDKGHEDRATRGAKTRRRGRNGDEATRGTVKNKKYYKSQSVSEKRRGEQQTTLTKLDAARRKGRGNKLSQISEDELETFIRSQQQICLNKKKGGLSVTA